MRSLPFTNEFDAVFSNAALHWLTNMEEWLPTFRRGVLAHMNDQDRDEAIAQTVKLLEPVLRDSTGAWWDDYVRLRFCAIKATA